MQPRTTTALAAATTVLLLITGCGASDGDTAQIETRPVDVTDTTSQPEAAATPSPAGSADDTDEADGTPTSSGSGEAPGRRLPQDVDDLDIEVNHPSGMTVWVTGISFDQYDIFVDVTVFNGSSEELYFSQEQPDITKVRLVDDGGGEYQYLPPEGEDATITVGPREELTARLAFGGPLRGEWDELRLANWGNVDDFDEQEHLVCKSHPKTEAPCFVIPIDLVWD